MELQAWLSQQPETNAAAAAWREKVEETRKANKGRIIIIRTKEDLKKIPVDARVLLVLGIDNGTEVDGKNAGAAFLAKNGDYKGPVVVILNDHGPLNGTMNKLVGGYHDPAHMAVIQGAVKAMLKNADGAPLKLLAHSDGTTALDRVLGNMGQQVENALNLAIHYFGSPQLWTAADHAVKWVVRNGDPVTWAGSAFRFGAKDTKRISGWGHSFENYMRDAGAVW